MGYYIQDDILDAALEQLASTAVAIFVCSQQPATYAEASVTYELAEITVDRYDFALSYVDGTPNGRSITLYQTDCDSADATGTGTYIAICTGAALLYVGPCASVSVTATKPVILRSVVFNFADPVAA